MYVKYWTTREKNKQIVVHEIGDAEARVGQFDNRYVFHNLLAARKFINKNVDALIEKFGKKIQIERVEDPNL